MASMDALSCVFACGDADDGEGAMIKICDRHGRSLPSLMGLIFFHVVELPANQRKIRNKIHLSFRSGGSSLGGSSSSGLWWRLP